MKEQIAQINSIAELLAEYTADIYTMSRSYRLDIQRMLDVMQELLDEIAAEQLAADRATP